jgi:hypothetical protein
VTRLSIPAVRAARRTASQITLLVIGASARQPLRVPGKISLRPHPAVVLTQRSEESGTERDLAIAAALALLDPEHHPLPIDVAHLQMTQLTATQAGTIEREEQRAVIQVLRARDQPLHLVGTKHHRQPKSLFRIRQVLTHVTSLQHVPAEEPQRADLRDHRPDRQTAILEEEQVVASELGWRDPIEARPVCWRNASTIWT